MTGQSLADGATGIALLYLEAGNWPAARTALQAAVADGVSTGPGASLFYGAPALAFVLAGRDQPGIANARATAAAGTVTVTRRRLHEAHRRIDQRRQPHFAEYDLIRGLTGLGVVLRRLDDRDLLDDVLDYLVRLTEPIGDLPGWWCHHGPDRNLPPPAGGHANQGIAHGVTGPLALLALTHLDGITVDGHAEAIARICAWLDQWQQHHHTGVWWPQTITIDDLDHGIPTQQQPLRPSWCYGTLGIARAQQLVGRATNDLARQRLAETAFTSCVADPGQLRLVTGRGLCHGTAGVLATARRIASDALVAPTPLLPLIRLHQHQTAADDEPVGLLDGTTGAALANTPATSWDTCLLLS